MRKITKKFRDAFQREACTVLDILGTLVPIPDRMPEEAIEYTVTTRAGLLKVYIYDDWIACRFEDVAKAREVVRSGTLNPYSGKWNWHGLGVVPSFAAALREVAA